METVIVKSRWTYSLVAGGVAAFTLVLPVSVLFDPVIFALPEFGILLLISFVFASALAAITFTSNATWSVATGGVAGLMAFAAVLWYAANV